MAHRRPGSGRRRALLLVAALIARACAAASTTLYDILEVSPSAGGKDLQRSFRRLALKWHPDKQPDAARRESAKKRFELIQGAYDTLRKPRLRAQYDMKLQQQERARRAGGGARDYDGGSGAGGGGRRGPRRQQNW